MSRHDWKRSEEEFLIENYESMTTEELCLALPNRNKKSINRKIEKLREEGKVGLRNRETVKRAYYQRTRSTTSNSASGGEKKTGRRKRGRLPVEGYGYEEV